LLLADGAEEAERVRPEADQSEGREQRQAQPGAGRHPHALALAVPVPARPEHEERQRQPGGHLDPHPRDQRGRAAAKTRVGAGCQHQRGGERQQQERVVVSAANGQLEQHRVQAHEGGGEARRVALLPGRTRDQRNRADTRSNRDPLQRPQPPGEPERRDRVAPEREQRAVGRVLEGPAHEQVCRIRRHLGGDVRVGVHSVQGAQTGEIEVAEHVLGDQRWAQQQHEMRGDDRHPQSAPRYGARGEQHSQVARGHDQRERLEATRCYAHVQALQGASQPVRPATAAGGDILRWTARRACGDEEYARKHA